MSHIKVIVCLHTTQKFYDMIKELFINLNSTFKCACNESYGNQCLFFCLCVDSYKNIIKKDCDIDVMKSKWLKFCTLGTSLNA